MTDEKFDGLVRALRGVGEDIGIYPKAISGYNDERDYKERDGFKNGWNAAVMEYGMEITKAVERASEGLSDEVTMLLSAGIAELRSDGSLFINMSDTWAWACADGELVKPDEISEVARLFEQWGWCGLLYWASKKHDDMRSEFKDINRFIDFVAREEAFVKAEPNSSKRAYLDLPT